MSSWPLALPTSSRVLFELLALVDSCNPIFVPFLNIRLEQLKQNQRQRNSSAKVKSEVGATF